MADEKSSAASAPPPGYGTVNNQPPYPPQTDPNAVPGAVPPPQQPPYPQPGQAQAQGMYPNDPPPKYEAPKEGYPPQGYPPQGGYQAVTAQPVPMAPAQNTIIVTDCGWGPQPRVMECSHCHALITTHVTYQAGALTWLAAGLICLFGCWAGCCLIPFCITDLQDADHRCPNCGRLVYTFHRL